ncbi:hypothetical protein [Pseudomonas sp. NPDC096950]|uniref:hypothetical protein n=1 Tax=Pseudomonas sp. NPDC096950 TaxID=3364485 RepID=UPI00383A03C8
MSFEPFILRSVDNARQWVDACSKSISWEPNDCATKLANMLGYGSWEVMVYAIENATPSRADEDVDLHTYKQRIKRYLHVLIVEHGVDPTVSLNLLQALSPSSNKPAKAFIPSETATCSLEIFDALRDLFEPGDKPFDEMDSPSSYAEESFPNQIESYRASQALEVCGRVLPSQWADFLSHLNWDVEFDGDEIPNIGEPSIFIEDDVYGEVPVYLSATTTSPFNYSDEITQSGSELERNACVGDFFLNRAESSVMLLLNRWPQFRKVGDIELCFLGCAFDSERMEWKALLFNHACDSVDALLALNEYVTDINIGHSTLHDNGGTLLRCACLALSESEFDSSSVMTVSVEQLKDEDTGWTIQRYTN